VSREDCGWLIVDHSLMVEYHNMASAAADTAAATVPATGAKLAAVDLPAASTNNAADTAALVCCCCFCGRVSLPPSSVTRQLMQCTWAHLRS
jgi:hypothetical protein